MGNKFTVQTKASEEPPKEETKEQTENVVKARNIRNAYLTRIGFGQAGEIMKKYQGMTVRDFKVPKWMEGYRQPTEEDQPNQNEVHEKIASNEKYNLSFVQVKTNDEIRRQFLQRMSKEGVWIPPSQRLPKSQSIIIFDWDDTLLCTSFLNSREDAMEIQSKNVLAQLKSLEEAVVRLINAAMNLGSTYIITNAMRGWVEYSSSIWTPGVLSVLEQVKAISARSEYEHKHPNNYHQWKVEAFLEMTKQFDTRTITNLICLGDSYIEIDAAHTLAK